MLENSSPSVVNGTLYIKSRNKSCRSHPKLYLKLKRESKGSCSELLAKARPSLTCGSHIEITALQELGVRPMAHELSTAQKYYSWTLICKTLAIIL